MVYAPCYKVRMPHPPFTYRFPAPPVCSARWTDADWKRFARRHGVVERRGPAPTWNFSGSVVPLARDAAGNVQFNERGEALYARLQPARHQLAQALPARTGPQPAMSKLVYLVFDESPQKKFAPYKEQVLAFDDPVKAVEKAKSLGYEDTFLGLGPENLKPGLKQMYWCGDVKLSVLTLEIQE